MSLIIKTATGSLADFAALSREAAPGFAQTGRRFPRGLRGLHGLRRDRRGAAAAEFALVVPVMMGLLFGTFEYGIAFFSFTAAQSAARDVTRQVAINTMLVGSAEAAIKARLPAWARQNATVSISQSAAANPAANVYTVVVSMPMSAATPLQFFSKVANPILRTELRMKQEMPYVAIP